MKKGDNSYEEREKDKVLWWRKKEKKSERWEKKTRDPVYAKVTGNRVPLIIINDETVDEGFRQEREFCVYVDNERFVSAVRVCWS